MSPLKLTAIEQTQLEHITTSASGAVQIDKLDKQIVMAMAWNFKSTILQAMWQAIKTT
jgi:actin-like ATPase involved in cell morphogenesis